MESGINRFRRLKRQIVFINMGFVTAVMLGLLLAIYALMNKQMEQQSVNVLTRVIREEQKSTFDTPVQENTGIEIPYFTVEMRNDGRPAFVNGQYYSVDSPSQIQIMTSIVLHSNDKSGWVKGYSFRYIKKIADNGVRISFVDCSYENNLRTSLLWSLIGLGLVVLSVFTMLSYFFAGWIVRPLEEYWKQQKQFIADASHELKTPLTVILANAELLIQSSATESLVEKRWLNNIYEEAKNMKTLILEMLVLAKKDSVSKEKKKLDRINLLDVLQESVLQFEPVFYQNNRVLQYHLPQEEIYISGNRESLAQVMKILLDNAIKYSPSDSITRITLRRSEIQRFPGALLSKINERILPCRNQQIEIIVANEGQEMNTSECRSIFKRFYRLDSARSGASGYGLGLSIASEIIAEHKGRIWASSSGGWNSFHVQIRMIK